MRKVSASVVTSLMVFGAATGLTAPAHADAVSNTVIIHYQDPAATGFDSYKDWNLWMWANGTTEDKFRGPEYFNGSDRFGKVWTHTIADSAGITSLGVIVRTDGWSKKDCKDCTDGGNRSIALDADGTTEVWITAGADAQYTTSAPEGAATSPWAAGAVDPNFDCDNNNVCIAHVVMPANQHVVIHYQDPTATGFKSYMNWDTYMWNTGSFGDHAWFNGSDSFGKVLTMDWTGMDRTKSFGLIIRKHDWSNRSHCSSDNCTDGDHGNRNVALEADGTTEIWVVRDAAEAYYTSKPSGTLNKVKADGSADGTLTVASAPWAANAVDPNYECADGACTPGALYPASQTFKIHYNRPAGDYGDSHGYNIWMWGTSTAADTQQNFTTTDSFGKLATVVIPGNAGLVSGAGFLIRSTDDWNTAVKDGGDRHLSVTEVADGGTGVTEIWLKQGDDTVYTADPFKRPTVSALSAVTGGPGAAITITGTNFDDVNKVTLERAAVPAVTASPASTTGTGANKVVHPAIKAVPAVTAATVNASFKVVSATKIVAAMPAGVAVVAGKIVVANPEFSASSSAVFTSKTTASKPVITTSTATGLVGGTVTVTGANVGAASSAKIGTVSVGSITVNAADSISFAVPAGTSDGKISVTTAGGTATAAKAFALVPSITSLSKTSVAIGGSVTVTGVNLAAVSSVKVGTKAITGFTKGATTVTFTVPAATASGKVTLVSAGGTVVSADTLAIIPAPKVTGVTGAKTGAAFTKGATLTIAGTDLTGATSVLFGASSISGYVVANDGKSITFTAPAGKTSMKISVVTPGGTATSSASYSTTS